LGDVTLHLLTFMGNGGKLLPQFYLLLDFFGHAGTLDRGDAAPFHVIRLMGKIPRWAFDAALDVRPAVHAPRLASGLQVPVLHDLPFLPQGLHQGAVVPVPLLGLGEALGPHPAHGALDVRVRVRGIVGSDLGHVQVHLGAHASGHK
jgi:hypothetical protein